MAGNVCPPAVSFGRVGIYTVLEAESQILKHWRNKQVDGFREVAVPVDKAPGVFGTLSLAVLLRHEIPASVDSGLSEPADDLVRNVGVMRGLNLDGALGTMLVEIVQ